MAVAFVATSVTAMMMTMKMSETTVASVELVLPRRNLGAGAAHVVRGARLAVDAAGRFRSLGAWIRDARIHYDRRQ